MLRLPSKRGAQRGFTLVEMLVVSALIALFAGLAVFSITTQLEQNKKKAAVAECRQIATAMSFAHQDLGFFPKICLLKFNYSNLIAEGSRLGFSDRTIEYHGHLVSNLSQKLKENWKGVYMTNSVDHLVDMQIPGVSQTMQWPADPWGNPYVAYLIHTDQVQSGSSTVPKQVFLENAGQPADYFAGIVSYGRNTVPGLGDNAYDNPPVFNARKNSRLYKDGTGPGRYVLLNPTDYNTSPAYLNDFLKTEPPTAASATAPTSQDPGSDDRVYQF